MPFTAQHIDTCLSGYLNDHHNRDGELLLGAYVDGNTTYQEVLDELLSELNARDMTFDGSFNYDSAEAAIRDQFSTVPDMSKVFDASLDVLSEEEAEMADPCQAWFLITWDASEEVETSAA